MTAEPILGGGAGPRGTPGRHVGRRTRLRRTLGWASWPLYVWTPAPRHQGRPPGAFLSVLHSGYAFSAASLLLDLVLWRVSGLPGSAVFLFAHQVWISLVVSVLLLNTGFLQHLDGRPLQRLGAANLMTMARVYFLPVLLYLLYLRQWKWALLGYIVLGLSDVADGAVARRRHEETKLGFVLDPLADILFHLGILVSLALASVLSWWTASLVVLRYGLLLAGSVILFFLKGEIWIQPTPFGKATGLAIALLTSAVLLRLGIGGDLDAFLRWSDRALAVLFAACVVHVVLIGRINYLRPAQGGSAVYRRGWGLLVGHRALDLPGAVEVPPVTRGSKEGASEDGTGAPPE